MFDMDSSDAIKRIDSVIYELSQLKKLLTEGTAVPPPSIQELISSRTCLNCKKKITAAQKSVRGCHQHCYRRIIRSIESGQLTENDAITAGILAPKQKSGRKKTGNTGLDALIAEKKHEYEVNESSKKPNTRKPKK